MSRIPKVWLITGCSRGLGRSIVEAALGAGDKVVATARKASQLKDFVDRYGDQVRAFELDVADPDSVNRAVKSTVEAFGRVDILVNNAGYADTAAIEDMSIESFKDQVDANFYGVVYMTKAVLPLMREKGYGHIFQISSIGDRIGSPGLSAYQSAKWAVCGFSTILAQEVAPLGIKVTVLEPGGMRTDWAGSSMDIPPISKPYEPTVGFMAKMLRESLSGKEPSDPDKIGQLIVKLTEISEPPTRLLIGTDAVEHAANSAVALSEVDKKWHHLSVSVGF